jgi:hypothetical protein
MFAKIAILVVLMLFGAAWWTSYSGWWLPTTAIVEAERRAIESRRSVRLGYVGSGPRYGK